MFQTINNEDNDYYDVKIGEDVFYVPREEIVKLDNNEDIKSFFLTAYKEVMNKKSDRGYFHNSYRRKILTVPIKNKLTLENK